MDVAASTVNCAQSRFSASVRLDRFLESRARDRPVADNRRCHDMFNGVDGSPRICSSAVRMYNVLSRALPLSGFLLLSPDRGRAALTRPLKLTANICLRASAALGAMFDATVANRK